MEANVIRHVVLWFILFIVLAGSGCSSKPPEADEIMVSALREPVLEHIAVEVLHEPTFEYMYVQSFKDGFAAVGRLSVRMEWVRKNGKWGILAISAKSNHDNGTL